MITSIGMLLSVVTARFILANWCYPFQYVILFSLSAIALIVASLGFWIIEEKPSAVSNRVPLLNVLKDIPNILRTDKNFFKFLIYSNIMGAALTLIPFYIGFAKNSFRMDSTILSSVLIIPFSIITPRNLV